MNDLFEVIHEDSDLLVLNKPAGLVCHPTKTDERSSLIGRVRLHLGHGEGRLVNRLDRETSGLVLVAKSAAVAGELGKLIEGSAVRKEYVAVVRGWVQPELMIMDGALGKDERSAVAIKDCVRPDGASARTEATVVRRFGREAHDFTLLAVRPLSGRKHQIRTHLAHAGHPIVGDKIYGGDEQMYLRFVRGELNEADRAQLILANHGLHAGGLQFEWRGRNWIFQAAPSEEFQNFVTASQ